MKKKVSILKYLTIVLSIGCMSCAGGHVSQNGLFQKDHKELKESLVGVWQVANAGQDMYEFYREGNDIKLKVLGVATEIERFDSTDGVTFSFEYKDESGNATFVLGQFKSYQRLGFLAIAESPASQKAQSMFSLEKKLKTQVVMVEGEGSSE